MNRNLLFASLAGLLVACGGAPDASDRIGSSSSNDVAIDSYNASFQFVAPEPCEVFVIRRIAALDSHVVEYDLRVRETPLTLLYRFSPGDPLPIETQIATASGAPLLSMQMSDADLSVRDANGDETL